MSATMDASCCCGRVQCAYWNYNNAIIQGLEKDLRGAAQVGQVRPFLDDPTNPGSTHHLNLLVVPPLTITVAC